MGHEEDIAGTLDAFETQLIETLTHLYNPVYAPSALMWSVLGCETEQGVEAIWKAIVKCIEELRPPAETPPEARAWRLYNVLLLRYARQYTQDKTADLMGITTRHLRREQQDAVRLLARRLWSQRSTTSQTSDAPVLLSPQVQSSSDDAWRVQVHQELEALLANTPGAVSQLLSQLNRAFELSKELLTRQQVRIDRPSTGEEFQVQLHPSILSQLLLGCIEMLTGQAHDALLKAWTTTREGTLTVHLELHAAVPPTIEISGLVLELTRAANIALRTQTEALKSSIEIDLPLARASKVFLVDDNPDLVHFFQRYTHNTRYRIIPYDISGDVIEQIAQEQPDIIMLDVMLPDIDGWELLSVLRQKPVTRGIPIIVCSVTKGQELAKSMGAALFVQKPVGRREFLMALDQVSSGAEQHTR